MDISSRGIQCAGAILLVCGCLHAVTITPLPYRGNEAGFRLPRGKATFLDQEEGNRIRREMTDEERSPGFYGINVYDRYSYRGIRNSDDGNRYFGNEIDNDLYYERRSRDYYPNYNPEGSSSNRREYDCSQRGRPYDNRGQFGYNWGNTGYNGRGGYDDRARQVYVYNRNRGRGYEDRSRGYQPGYSRSRGGFPVVDNDPLGAKGYYGSSDKEDNIGEGTVGFYGRSRRP